MERFFDLELKIDFVEKSIKIWGGDGKMKSRFSLERNI